MFFLYVSPDFTPTSRFHPNISSILEIRDKICFQFCLKCNEKTAGCMILTSFACCAIGFTSVVRILFPLGDYLGTFSPIFITVSAAISVAVKNVCCSGDFLPTKIICITIYFSRIFKNSGEKIKSNGPKDLAKLVAIISFSSAKVLMKDSDFYFEVKPSLENEINYAASIQYRD